MEADSSFSFGVDVATDGMSNGSFRAGFRMNASPIIVYFSLSPSLRFHSHFRLNSGLKAVFRLHALVGFEREK
jgi:hypothetical protein